MYYSGVGEMKKYCIKNRITNLVYQKGVITNMHVLVEKVIEDNKYEIISCNQRSNKLNVFVKEKEVLSENIRTNNS